MRKRLLILGTLVLLAIGLVLILRLLVRGVADWLAGALDSILPYLQLVPQPVLWTVFVAILLFVMLDSLIGIRWRRRSEQAGARTRPGRVGTWQQAIRRANRDSMYRDAYRWRLAQDLANLTEEVLARNEPPRAGAARRPAGAACAELPASVQDCLAATQSTVIFRRRSLLQRLFRRPSRHSPLDFDLEEVVSFLEEQMEV